MGVGRGTGGAFAPTRINKFGIFPLTFLVEKCSHFSFELQKEISPLLPPGENPSDAHDSHTLISFLFS